MSHSLFFLGGGGVGLKIQKIFIKKRSQHFIENLSVKIKKNLGNTIQKMFPRNVISIDGN